MKRCCLFLPLALLVGLLSGRCLYAASPALTIMARTGEADLNSIDPNIAINKDGLIAFTGRDSTGSRVFVVSTAGQISPVLNATTGRTYAGVGITSGPNPGVVYRDLVSASPPGFILRESFVPGPTTVILGSSVSVSGPADWDSITSNSIDISSNGIAVVSGLINGSLDTALFIGSSRPLTQAAIFSGAIGLRPEISDSGEAVIRDDVGRIITYAANGPLRIAAGAGFDLGTTGNRPGISADGSAIAFSGSRTNSVPGVYAFVTPAGRTPVLVNVAGGALADGFTSFTSEQRVGVRALHSTQGNVSTDLFTVVFEGFKGPTVDGVYARDVIFTNGVQEPLGPLMTLVRPGDQLGGSTVQSFALYHPINEAGTIAFTITLSGGDTAIVRAKQGLEGVDVSSALIPAVPNWGNTIYDKDGKRFFVQDVWSGLNKFTKSFQHNYPIIANSKIGASMTAAYAVINNNNAAKSIIGYPPGSDQTGDVQVQQAFDVLKGSPVAFMAIDVENNPGIAPNISPTDYVARIADAIWAVWTRGVPAIIYVRRSDWATLTGDSIEIQGTPSWDIPLWDASSTGDPEQDDTLEGFTPYGPWAERLARQYVLDSKANPSVLEGQHVDLDIFDPRIFALPRPPVGSAPALAIRNPRLTRGQQLLVLQGIVSNDAPSSGPLSPALATRIDSASIQVGTTIYPGKSSGIPVSKANPIILNTLPVGGSSNFGVLFPFSSLPPSGTPVTVRLSLTCGGGSFKLSFRNLKVP